MVQHHPCHSVIYSSVCCLIILILLRMGQNHVNPFLCRKWLHSMFATFMSVPNKITWHIHLIILGTAQQGSVVSFNLCHLLLNVLSAVVDSLKSTEIVVSFSSLSYWNETPVIATKDESKTPMKLGVRDIKNDRESRLADVPNETTVSPDAHPYVTGNSIFLHITLFLWPCWARLACRGIMFSYVFRLSIHSSIFAFACNDYLLYVHCVLSVALLKKQMNEWMNLLMWLSIYQLPNLWTRSFESEWNLFWCQLAQVVHGAREWNSQL